MPVSDISFFPKVDGIACPELDRYNVLITILEKEKGHSPIRVNESNIYTGDVPQNTHGDYIKLYVS
jgi:hypothetical protein